MRSGRALIVAGALVVATGGSVADAETGTTREHGVGRRVETFIDRTRATPPNGTFAGAPERTLRTLVYYPSRESAGDDVENRARPARGRFPVVLFSHGANATPELHEGLLAEWVSVGYIVIAPEYPLSSSNAPGGWTHDDRDQQPADASFVLDRALRVRWLSSHVDRELIAAAGHSLGGYTTFLLAYGRCCRDERVDAAITLAGVGYGAGGVADEPDPPPLLLVHDEDDRSVHVAESEHAFSEARGPRALVTVHESITDLAHVLPYVGGARPAADVTTATTLDFLAFALRRDDGALQRLCRHGSEPGIAEVMVAGAGRNRRGSGGGC